MPILPPSTGLPYDSLNYILDGVRAKMGVDIDSLEALSGSVFSRTDAYMNQLCNDAWRETQDCLAELGYSRLLSRVIIQGLPVVQVTDPCQQVWLSWDGYFDGANLNLTPALPSDFTHPLQVWERPTGQNSADFLMEKILSDLPSIGKQPFNRFWNWRGDAIWMPGAQQINDLIISYVSYLSDFVDSGTVRWFQQTVPILRCSNAFGWYIAAELENARKDGDPDRAAAYATKGEAACAKIMNRDIKANQRVNIRRQSNSGRLERNYAWNNNYY